MRHQVVLMRVEPGLIPPQFGAASVLNIDAPLEALLDGWEVVSHSFSYSLDGAAILSVFCERS